MSERQLQPCGTTAAYQRHIKRGEAACFPCLKAYRERRAEMRASDPKLRARETRNKLARDRALARLAREFPKRFEELRIEELRARP